MYCFIRNPVGINFDETRFYQLFQQVKQYLNGRIPDSRVQDVTAY